jgi:polyhydroxyalkanoate synthesis regulator phasin
MDPGWLATVVATAAAVVGAIFTKIADHLLGKGKLRVDEAAQLRTELRGDINRKAAELKALEVRKDGRIAALEQRVSALEEDLDKTERERDALDRQYERYKLDVYRTLVTAGANKDLIDTVLAIR